MLYIKKYTTKYIEVSQLDKKVVYERDIVFSVADDNELVTLHVEVLELTRNGRIPVICKTNSRHIIVDHIDKITKRLQEDIFDRLDINVKNSVDINIKANDETRKRYGDKNYIRLTYKDDKPYLEGIDEIKI